MWSSFLVLSAKRADLLIVNAKPSSLYRPMISLPNFLLRWFRMKRPTNSHISALSWPPMATSNKPSLSFLVHGFPVLKSRDFLAFFMIKISLSEMVVKLEAQDNAWTKSFSEMYGYIPIHFGKNNIYILFVCSYTMARNGGQQAVRRAGPCSLDNSVHDTDQWLSLVNTKVAGHFAERHFAERHFAERHFAERTFCRRTFCRTDVLPNGRFAERTFGRFSY